jgi:hypothetical protein
MTDLEQAAQAVLVRWDSPTWDWAHQGPTAALMADLRRALAAHKEQAEPVVEPVQAARRLLEACEQRLPLRGQAEITDELNALRAALQQAEPVVEPVVEPARDLAHEKEMRELQQRQVASDCADDSGNPSY